MKKTILVKPEREFRENLKKWEILTVALGVLALLLTAVFVGMRNDENHILMYTLTVFTDVIYAWYLIAVFNVVILPRRRLLALFKGKISSYKGKIVNISEQTERVRSIDCHKIIVGEDDERRVLFLPDTLSLSVGEVPLFSVMSNFILEVIYE